MGAVAWTVSVRPVYGKNKHMMCMDGELSINDEAGNHYVDCRKDMVPLYKMQNELNRFIAECEEGFADLEAHNEGLKQYKEADE
jgi:hypothetical protein